MNDQQGALPLILEIVDSPEDDGAEAQANFRFQCEVIARWCYGLLDPNGPTAVVCEHHEDFIVMFGDGSLDLASVKHRGRNRGTWSIADLCGEGGLTHLFDRWLAVSASGRTIRVLHVSNAGLTQGDGQSAELSKLCDSPQRDPADLLGWAKKLTRQFLMVARHKRTPSIPQREPPARADLLDDCDSLVSAVSRFIAILTFIAVPHRDDIAASTIVDKLLPLRQDRGWGTHEGQRYHEGVVALVEKTARSFGKRRLDLAQQLIDLAMWPAAAEREERLASRLLDQSILETITINELDVPLVPPGEALLPAPGGADLRRKMNDGRLPVTAHRLAERWRSAWYTTHRSRLPDLPGDASVIFQIETEVLEQVLDAQDAVTRSGATPYGPALFHHLRDNIRVSAFRDPPPLRMNDQHALGVAFELSEQCEFDFLAPNEAGPDNPVGTTETSHA
ncbi:dsDNA nuclease domain-containing protein [Actinoplanes sp. NPDC049681]|uniref:dsDNA nuclease domain-containing protein n=1 Tax=Actinoplanes sp. NPDC049681 TaxID=3363905 RepID=UPI00379E8666